MMKIVYFILSIFVAVTVSRLTPNEYFGAMSASEKYILLDVRMYEKYQMERIPGALYAGEKTILFELLKNIEKKTDVFIYCSYGDRSVEVIKILKRNGFKTIYDLSEGFEQWYIENMPIDTVMLPNLDF